MLTLFEPAPQVDRNKLVDINKDEKLDAVVGYEGIGELAKLAWYEQGSDPTQPWTEHIVSDPSDPATRMIGPQSMDTADIDQDGDIDIVAGEHATTSPESGKVYIFENTDGVGGTWVRHQIDIGHEHHDGTKLVDIDSDGDLDVLSIGWTHGDVLLLENRAIVISSSTPTPTPIVTETPTPTSIISLTPTLTPTITPTATLTPIPTVTIIPTATFTPTVTPTPTTYVLTPLALYGFNEGSGTVGQDVSGNGYTGTISGSATHITPGKTG